MVRITAAVCLSWAVSACSLQHGDDPLTAYVPQGADAMIDIDLAALRSSRALRELLSSPGLASFTVSLQGSLTDCGTRLVDFDAIALGLHTPTANWLAAVRADGLALPQMADCLARRVPDAFRTPASAPGQRPTSLRSPPHWRADSHTLVFASSGWAQAVAERVRGRGQSALGSNLRNASIGANPRLPIWFVADLGATESRAGPTLAFADLASVSGTFYFNEQVHLSAYLRFRDETSANRFLSDIEVALRTPESTSAELELARVLADTCSIQAEGEVIGISGHFPIDRLTHLL
ncbi:MAG: hypothetical protein V3V08_25680 [Nannocystaceae bacterium]